MLLSRLLQSQGFGSRRECRAQVLSGQVSINGQSSDNPDADIPIDDTLQLSVKGETLPYRAKAYLVLHKPAGYECSRQPLHHPSVFSLLPVPLIQRGVQCVGRLDQDTTGLLLFSDDGDFIHRTASPKKQVGKVYEVTCKHPVDDGLIAALTTGVQLHDEPAPVTALACVRLSACRLQLTIAEGKYHQVKRMIAAAGNRVEALHRVAMGGYTLPQDLPSGAWRWLTEADLMHLEGH
jgi:16S rRNA pseudouridine516 synthase